jgi:hypothetical protein
MRSKRVIGIRKVGKLEGHGVMSAMMGDVGLTGTLIEGSIDLKHRNLERREQTAHERKNEK